MLEAGQLADAADLGIHRAQARTVTLAPDHALEMRRRDLAAALHQRAVGIKEQLRVVDGAAVTLVDADRHHHAGLACRLGNRIRCGGRNSDCLLQQSQVLFSGQQFNARLDGGEVRVVRHHGFRKGCELHALLAEFADLASDLFDGGFPAVKHGADLHCGGFDAGHDEVLKVMMYMHHMV